MPRKTLSENIHPERIKCIEAIKKIKVDFNDKNKEVYKIALAAAIAAIKNLEP